METDDAMMEQFEKDYEAWFLQKVPSLKIPPWSSVEGNLYWIRYTYAFARELFESLQQKFGNQPISVLDVGAGKGFLSFLCSKRIKTEVHAVDVHVNPFFAAFQKEWEPDNVIYRSIQDGHIPYPPSSFDLILLIEVLEHCETPKRLIQECLDLLKPNGILVITTPPRFRFLLRKDPHFRIKYLYLLPLTIQNYIVEKIFHYSRVEGYSDYKVYRIFWNIKQFTALCNSTRHQTRISVEPRGSIFTWRRILVEKLPDGQPKK